MCQRTFRLFDATLSCFYASAVGAKSLILDVLHNIYTKCNAYIIIYRS